MVVPPAVARGQAEVLGTVVLLGIVVIASLLIAGMAMGSLGVVQEQTANEAIERSLLDLRSSVADVALEGESTRTVAFDLPDGAEVRAANEPGEIRIVHTGWDGAGTSRELYHQPDLGTFEVAYNGVRYGLEGGGLFRLEGDRGSLIAAPNLALRGYTANLPVLRLESSELLASDGPLEITPGDHVRPAFPDPSVFYGEDGKAPLDNPVYNGSIEISVTSDYFEGWHDFFVQYTDGNVSIDPANRTVTASVESLQELTFEEEITYGSDFNEHGNADVEGVSHAPFFPDIQPLMDDQFDEADEADALPESCGDGTIGGCTIESGTYYLGGGMHVDNDIIIDTEEGDVTFLIDGDLTVHDDIVVTGPADHGVEYYVTGSFNVGGDAWIGTDAEASQSHRNLVMVSGDSMESGQGSATLDIVLYAPNAEVSITGNPTITGAIIGDEVSVGGNAEVSFDVGLATFDGIDVSQTSTPIMYLHITENTAVVSG